MYKYNSLLHYSWFFCTPGSKLATSTPEECNTTDKPILVISPIRYTHTSNSNHRFSSHRIQVVNWDLALSLDVKDVTLAFRSDTLVRASNIVIVKEGVKTSAVNRDACGILDVETPSVDGTWGVIPTCVRGVGPAGGGFVVSRFCLNLSLCEVSIVSRSLADPLLNSPRQYPSLRLDCTHTADDVQPKCHRASFHLS